MSHFPLHRAAAAGDLVRATELLDASENAAYDLSKRDAQGMTPLGCAAFSAVAKVSMLALLLARGANIHQQTDGEFGAGQTALTFACSARDTQKIDLLINAGAHVRHCSAKGYGALLHAIHGRKTGTDAQLFAVLQLLIDRRADPNEESAYGETPLRSLARFGNFLGVQLLLNAGADLIQLEWNDLMLATATGSVDGMKHALGASVNLEDKDWLDRTVYLLAVQTGSTEKVGLLLAHGASRNARGRRGQTALSIAIESDQVEMLRWLISDGADLTQTDDSGRTAVQDAIDAGNLPALTALLDAGAPVTSGTSDIPALFDVTDLGIVKCLLAAGCDPQDISHGAKRTMLGFNPDTDDQLYGVNQADFERDGVRRFGTNNPEEMAVPLWHAMIRGGMNAWHATSQFDADSNGEKRPVWCAQRFGQSVTFLPDGRIVFIAGEHEDSYDPDFCIYNDVWVREIDGTIRIFGYPEAAFPPTDFHTATTVGSTIYIIGNLGYGERRRPGSTPVYCLDTRSWCIRKLETAGDCPGWLWKHRACLLGDDEIQVEGGNIHLDDGNVDQPQTKVYALNLSTRVWREVTA